MRPRSADAHARVLSAATELFAERGIDGTSMDSISERSGVSKATIYKHWSDKDALLMEVMFEVTGMKERPVFDSGNIRRDMVDILAYRPNENSELRNRIMPHFMAYSAHNVNFGDLWRTRVTDPPRQDLKQLLKKAAAAGELAPPETELALAMLLGPMLYWFLLLRRQRKDPNELAEAVVDGFWQAFGTAKKKRALS